MHAAILTYAALKQFVEAMLLAANFQRKPDDKDTIDDELFWFVSLERADEFANANTREFAEMMLEGVEPMSEQNIGDWLDGFYCELHTYDNNVAKQQLYIEAHNGLLEAKLKHHYELIDDEALDNAYEMWRTAIGEVTG